MYLSSWNPRLLINQISNSNYLSNIGLIIVQENDNFYLIAIHSLIVTLISSASCAFRGASLLSVAMEAILSTISMPSRILPKTAY
jgi:hypothetical protein